MIRLRRYRVFLIFSVISLFALIHLARSRGWSSVPDLIISTPSSDPPSDPPSPPPQRPPAPASPEEKSPVGSQKEDAFSSHGFAPEAGQVGKPNERPSSLNSAVDDTRKDSPVSNQPPPRPGSSPLSPPASSPPNQADHQPDSGSSLKSPGKGPSSSFSPPSSPNQPDHHVDSGSSLESSGKGPSSPFSPSSPNQPDHHADSGSSLESSSKGSSSPASPLPDHKADKDSSSHITQMSSHGQGRLEANRPDTDIPEPHWKKFPEHFPVAKDALIHLPTARPMSLPKLQVTLKDESSTEKLKREQKLALIKDAFVHAWTGYSQNAMGHDEVKPMSGDYRNPFNGWGATLVDSLDTLWIMGLRDEFANAVDQVKKIDFTISPRKDIPLFETTIRYLGGLLGAYDVSGHKYPVLLDKAVELAEILIGAFDTPNRIPQTFYYWAPDYVSQPHRATSNIVLAELGTLSLEFTRLAQLTKEDKYYDAVARITNELEIWQNKTQLPGMWPLRVDGSGCAKIKSKPVLAAPGLSDPSLTTPKPPTDADSYTKFIQKRAGTEVGLAADAEPANYKGSVGSSIASQLPPSQESLCVEVGLQSLPYVTSEEFGLGALADSTYEYLPKEYMLLGGLNDQYASMYAAAMQATRENLVFRPMIKEADRDLRFIASVSIGQEDYITEGGDSEERRYKHDGTHLTCFVGGMFAIASKLFDIKGDLDLASKLTDACVWAYETTPSGIMPEGFQYIPCADEINCPWNETVYRDILDPDYEGRIAQAERNYQRQVRVAKDYYDREKSLKSLKNIKSEPVSLNSLDIIHTSPAAPGSPNVYAEDEKKMGHVLKRDVGSSDPTPWSPTDRNSAQYPEVGKLPTTSYSTGTDKEEDDEFVLPARPYIPTHEEYAKERIKSENLPPGMAKVSGRKYILRPEAIESVFIMFRLTGDNYWREKGWKMFQAVDKATRTEIAHSAISDVTSEFPLKIDEMESFWLAETLKYFYLLFADPSVISLDEYVFNTEAHPLKRPT